MNLMDLPPIYAVGYDAVSKAEMGKGENVEMREAEHDEYAAKNIVMDRQGNLRRLVILHPFHDIGISRGESRREELVGRDDAMQALKLGYWDQEPYVGVPVELLISSGIERISRERRFAPVLEDMAGDDHMPFWGVVSSGQKRVYNLTDTADRDEFADQMSAGQKYNSALSINQRRKKRWRAQQGAWGCGPGFGYRLVKEPIGYDANGEPVKDSKGEPIMVTTLRIEEGEAELVRDAVRRVLAGETLQAIIRKWNRDGKRTMRGVRWTRKKLRDILRSPRIAGLVKHQPTRVIPGTRKRVPDGDAQTYPGRHPAIVSVKDWEDVGGILEARRKSRSNARVNPLTGLARHQACGAKVISGRNAGGELRVVCPTEDDGMGREGCGGLGCLADPFIDLFFRAAYAVLDSEEFWKAYARAKAVAEDGNEELRRLRIEQDRDQGLLDGLHERALELDTPAEIEKRKRAEVERRMETRGHRIAKLTGTPDAPEVIERGEALWRGLVEGRFSVARRARIAAWLAEDLLITSPGRGYKPFDPNNMEIVWRDEVVPEGVAAAAWKEAVQATPRVRPGTPRGGQTHCKRDHDLTDPGNVYLHNGRRHCRACRALWAQENRERIREQQRARRELKRAA